MKTYRLLRTLLKTGSGILTSAYFLFSGYLPGQRCNGEIRIQIIEVENEQFEKFRSGKIIKSHYSWKMKSVTHKVSLIDETLPLLNRYKNQTGFELSYGCYTTATLNIENKHTGNVMIIHFFNLQDAEPYFLNIIFQAGEFEIRIKDGLTYDNYPNGDITPKEWLPK